MLKPPTIDEMATLAHSIGRLEGQAALIQALIESEGKRLSMMGEIRELHASIEADREVSAAMKARGARSSP